MNDKPTTKPATTNVDAIDVKVGQSLWYDGAIREVTRRKRVKSRDPDESEKTVHLWFEDGTTASGLDGSVCYLVTGDG